MEKAAKIGFEISNRLKKRKQPARILFIRSNCHSTFAAYMACDLECLSSIHFEQYPPYSDSEWDKIEKIFDPQNGLKHLNKHTIQTADELVDKINSGHFDLVLLMDYDARLFTYCQIGRIKKWRNLLGHFKSILVAGSVPVAITKRWFSLATISRKQFSILFLTVNMFSPSLKY